MKYFFLFIVSLNLFAQTNQGNTTINSFRESKKILPMIHGTHGKTFYCGCDFSDKKIDLDSCGVEIREHKNRANFLEWEHIVTADQMAQSFEEGRNGHPRCVKKKTVNGKVKLSRYKGRKCAGKISGLFRRMEADLYNLKPSVGAINGARSNFIFTDGIHVLAPMFGKCDLIIIDGKIQPPPSIKGDIARIYLYMDFAYPGREIINKNNRELMEYWNKNDPVDINECQLTDSIAKIQGNYNPFVFGPCQELKKTL